MIKSSKKNMKKNIAIILAGGIGSRIPGDTPKQFQLLNNKMIIDYSIKIFSNHHLVNNIIIVCHENWINILEELCVAEFAIKYHGIDSGASILFFIEINKESFKTLSIIFIIFKNYIS